MAVFEDYGSYQKWCKSSLESEIDVDYINYELQLEREKNQKLEKDLECLSQKHIDEIACNTIKELLEKNLELHDRLSLTEFLVVAVCAAAVLLFQWC